MARARRFEVGDVESVLARKDTLNGMQRGQRRTFQGFHSANPEFFFVAEADKESLDSYMEANLILQRKVLAKWKSGKGASVEMLAVDEAHRRQGIASSLLTGLFEVFKQKEIDLVTQSVPVVEVEAMKLYGKLGF